MAYKKSVAECKNLLDCESAAPYLDVRTPEEFEEGHVKDAVNIPFMFKEAGTMVPNPGFLEAVTETFNDKDSAIVVGCRSGARSAKACDAMKEAGYSNLTDVEGGYDAWKAAGL
jgi:rhodanese-related sulfurtransferase